MSLECAEVVYSVDIMSCSMCSMTTHTDSAKTNKQRLPHLCRVSGFNIINCVRRSLDESLTEWVLFCRVVSTPCRLAHVCSFSPALRFDTSDSSKLCGSSSLCSLLRPDMFPPRWRSAPSAEENNPSARMQDTGIMFTMRLPNFGLSEQLLCPQQLFLAPHAPLITTTKCISNDGPSTAAEDWSGPE